MPAFNETKSKHDTHDIAQIVAICIGILGWSIINTTSLNHLITKHHAHKFQ